MTHYISYFFGGAFLTNAIPHFVSGLTGRPFQTPFARLRGKIYSTSTTNILWGSFNIVIGYLLIFHAGQFNIHSAKHVLAAGAGAFVIALFSAKVFGMQNGGDKP